MGTLTANKGYTQPTIGGDTGPAFAQEINGNIAIQDANMGGVNVLNVGGNVNVTLNSTQAQNLIQQVTGILTGNVTVLLPPVGSFYAIENATSGAFILSVGCTGGGNVQPIPQGLSTWIWTDGSFTRLSNPPGWQEIATYLINSAASQIITLPAPFRRFRLTLQSLQVSNTGSAVSLQTSTNGGSSFATASYANADAFFALNGTSILGGSAQTARISLTGNMLSPSIIDGTYELYPGASGSAGTFKVRGQFCGANSSSLFEVGIIAGSSPDVGVNAITIFPAPSGVLFGTIILEGLP